MLTCDEPECAGKRFATAADFHYFVFHKVKYQAYRCSVCDHHDVDDRDFRAHFRKHNGVELSSDELKEMVSHVPAGFKHLGCCLSCIWRHHDTEEVARHRMTCRFRLDRSAIPPQQPAQYPPPLLQQRGRGARPSRPDTSRGNGPLPQRNNTQPTQPFVMREQSARIERETLTPAQSGGREDEHSDMVTEYSSSDDDTQTLGSDEPEEIGTSEDSDLTRPEWPDVKITDGDRAFAMDQQLRDPDTEAVDHPIMLRGNLFSRSRQDNGKLFTRVYVDGLMAPGVYSIARREEQSRTIGWGIYCLHYSNPVAFIAPDTRRRRLFHITAEMVCYPKQWVMNGELQLSYRFTDGKYWLRSDKQQFLMTLSDVNLFTD